MQIRIFRLYNHINIAEKLENETFVIFYTYNKYIIIRMRAVSTFDDKESYACRRDVILRVYRILQTQS